MAHFLKPDAAPPAPYSIDNKLAPGSLGKITIPPGGTLEVALWGGAGLKVTSKNNTVVPSDRITERPYGDLRILSLYGGSIGSSLLETGGSVTLPVVVGAVAGAMADAAQAALNISCKQTILTALADPAINKIKLSIDGFDINPQSYARVREKIMAGKIEVKYNPRLISSATGNPYAFYHAPTNVLNCGFSSAAAAPRRGLVIHEATHAACDIANDFSMTTVTSEALAYLAQAIFMLEKQPDAPLQEDPIICASQVLAGMIIAGNTLKSDDLKSLRDAIRDSPEYKGKAPTPGYDGVP